MTLENPFADLAQLSQRSFTSIAELFTSLILLYCGEGALCIAVVLLANTAMFQNSAAE